MHKTYIIKTDKTKIVKIKGCDNNLNGKRRTGASVWQRDGSYLCSLRYIGKFFYGISKHILLSIKLAEKKKINIGVINYKYCVIFKISINLGYNTIFCEIF